MNGEDDKISAWIDGGLDAEGTEAMELEANSNEAIALRAVRFRKLDALVREAIPLDDQVPDELLARLGLPAARLAPDNVVSLADARASRLGGETPTPPRFWQSLTSGRLAAQWVLLLGLGLSGVLYLSNPTQFGPQADYHALGDATRAGELVQQPNAVAMFAPGTDQLRIRALLSNAGVRVIGQPSAEGVWKLSAPVEKRDAILQQLRNDPAVVMAQPLDGGVGQ